MITPGESDPLETEETDTAFQITGVFFLYFITARLGLSLSSTHTFASLIWPPSGIAFAAFLLYGARVWPAVFSAALLVNVSIGAPFLSAVGIAFGSTVVPALGASLLRWYAAYSKSHPTLPPMEDNWSIMLGAFLMPVLTATVGVGSLWLGGAISSSEFLPTWETWWVGNMLGILIFTPFIVGWFDTPLIEREPNEEVEFGLVLLVVAMTSYLVFWLPQPTFAYYIFIPLTWAALRTRQRGVTLSILLVASIAVSGTLMGHGRFAAEGGLWNLQLFLASMAAIMLAFSSAVEERRKGYDTLKQHAHDLESALTTIRSEDAAKKEFIGVLAHELRNPLATIISSIELIELQGLDDANSPPLLTTINERSRAMVRLLDDLLDISRISKKKLTLYKETISVTEFMHKLDELVRPLMKRYGHDFSLSKPPRPLYVRADPIRLEQILMNLLANSARYTRTRGFIQVEADKEGDMLAIHIQDSGVGIPRGMLRRIFEPFFQINKERISREGIGVGLTLTRDLIEMHGGTIEARNGGIGNGSELIVRLPLAPAPEEIQLAPVAAPLATAKQSYQRMPRQLKRTHKILVIDDNQDAANTLSQLLMLRGHTTAVAHTGASGVEKALEFAPEAIFLDIGLPDMTGYDVAVKLREQHKPYFLIALTGYGQEDDKSKAKRVGIDQYLTKPAGLKEIQAVLRKVPHAKTSEEA